MEQESSLVEKTNCEACGSSDANAVYDDGHCFCFSCGQYTKGDGVTGSSQAATPVDFTPVQGQFRALSKRGISEETCKKYGYRVGIHRGEMVHICDVRLQDGTLVAQKIRTQGKDFSLEGSVKKKPLTGMHLFSGGKKLVITEGEIDMMTMSQCQGNRYPVVSLPNGAQNARKVIAHNLKWLEGFQEIIICFDMDDVGQKAAQECAELLMHLDVKVMQLPLKDPNEMLLAGRTEELLNAMWNAPAFKPDSLLSADELIEQALAPREKGIEWCIEGMNWASNGRSWGTIQLFGAGAGSGKTSLVLQQADYDMRILNQPTGLFLLENEATEVLRMLAGKADGRLYHEEGHPDYEAVDDMRKAMKRYSGKLYVYDNFGLCDWQSIRAQILFLISKGFRVFTVDNLTALATGGDKDERKVLEDIMADMATLVKRHNIIIHLVSHLATPEGKSHEEGGHIALKHMKGSRMIGSWVHAAWGLERNQQAETEDERYTTTCRLLKRRGYGKGVGRVVKLMYNPDKDTSSEVKQQDATQSFSSKSDEDF